MQRTSETKKRERKNFEPQELIELNASYNKNRLPNVYEIQRLAKLLNRKVSSIKYWFGNQYKRRKKEDEIIQEEVIQDRNKWLQSILCHKQPIIKDHYCFQKEIEKGDYDAFNHNVEFYYETQNNYTGLLDNFGVFASSQTLISSQKDKNCLGESSKETDKKKYN